MGNLNTSPQFEVRLSPSGRPETSKRESGLSAGIGAGNGDRTRDPKLGKLVLCQLSYARPCFPRSLPGAFKCNHSDSQRPYYKFENGEVKQIVRPHTTRLRPGLPEARIGKTLTDALANLTISN